MLRCFGSLPIIFALSSWRMGIMSLGYSNQHNYRCNPISPISLHRYTVYTCIYTSYIYIYCQVSYISRGFGGFIYYILLYIHIYTSRLKRVYQKKLLIKQIAHVISQVPGIGYRVISVVECLLQECWDGLGEQNLRTEISAEFPGWWKGICWCQPHETDKRSEASVWFCYRFGSGFQDSIKSLVSTLKP